jgi:hypothetical protein
MSGELRSRFRGDFLVRKKKKAGNNHQIPGNPHNIYLPKKGLGYDVM